MKGAAAPNPRSLPRLTTMNGTFATSLNPPAGTHGDSKTKAEREREREREGKNFLLQSISREEQHEERRQASEDEEVFLRSRHLVRAETVVGVVLESRNCFCLCDERVLERKEGSKRGSFRGEQTQKNKVQGRTRKFGNHPAPPAPPYPPSKGLKHIDFRCLTVSKPIEASRISRGDHSAANYVVENFSHSV